MKRAEREYDLAGECCEEGSVHMSILGSTCMDMLGPENCVVRCRIKDGRSVCILHLHLVVSCLDALVAARAACGWTGGGYFAPGQNRKQLRYGQTCLEAFTTAD